MYVCMVYGGVFGLEECVEWYEVEVDSEGRMCGRRKMKLGDEEWEICYG